MIIEFFKTDPGSKAPTRANPSDAGLDIYARLNSRGVLSRCGGIGCCSPQASKLESLTAICYK
jgi:hypothetical protein